MPRNRKFEQPENPPEPTPLDPRPCRTHWERRARALRVVFTEITSTRKLSSLVLNAVVPRVPRGS